MARLGQDRFAMGQLNFISRPRVKQGHPHSLRAFVASCLFHGLLLGSVVGLGFLYRSHLPLIPSGSAPGASVISLETMVITSPPPPTVPPTTPHLVTETPATLSPSMPHQPVALPKLPEEGVPVLATQPNKPLPEKTAAILSASHPTTSHSTAAISVSHDKPAAAAALSSYAPGANVLPHPPYPMEARDLRETGVVVMNVQFNIKGDVARAEVAQSSGVPILDSETRSFIRSHWHSTTYAGQTISQPVEYSLENL